MGVAIFFVIAAVAAVIVVYPLLPGRMASQPAPTVSSEDIERAVRDLRLRSQGALLCPACGHPYRTGDRFCVRCGGALPEAGVVGRKCPSCGAALLENDLFCSRCGWSVADGEVG